MTDWTAPPSTYLAICTALGNLAVRIASYQGIIVAWWYKALRGSTLADLHWDWHAGTTFRGALSSMVSTKRIGLLAVACIATSLSILDGPLTQRSSTVATATLTSIVPLHVSLAPEVPHEFTGYYQKVRNFRNSEDGFNQAYNQTMPSSEGDIPNTMIAGVDQAVAGSLERKVYSDAPLPDVIAGCAGECKAKIRAPALAVTSCSSHEIPVDYAKSIASKQVIEQLVAPPLDTMALSISKSHDQNPLPCRDVGLTASRL